MLTSSRRLLSYPNPATRADTADVPRDISTVIAALELDVVFGQGTHAARPAAGAGAPTASGGGRLYWETDTLQLFYDTGAAWMGPLNTAAIGTGTITSAMIQDGTIASADIANLAIITALIADGAVTAAKLAAALFPSQGAGAGTEALRALGTAAGQAAAGSHAAQHSPLGADPAVTRVGCRLNGAGASLANGVNTLLSFTSEDWDSNALHDNTTNPSRITIPTGLAGIWKIWANLTFANPSEAGSIGFFIRKNGATQIGGNSSPSYTLGVNAEVEDLAAVGDYYELFAFQAHSPSSGAVATVAPSFFGARFQSA